MGPDKDSLCTKIAFISLPISLNMCFGCSKEPSHQDGSFEFPQHMFWLSNKKNNFPVRTLIWMPDGECSNILDIKLHVSACKIKAKTNMADPDQTAFEKAVCSGSPCLLS